MKKILMLSAALMVLSGSNAFASRGSSSVGNSASVATNCDPQANVNSTCNNEAAAVPDCPFQKKSAMNAGRIYKDGAANTQEARVQSRTTVK